MTRLDYDVLSWQVDAAFEWEELRHEYISGRHDGVYLRIARGRRLANLEFLDNLPELKYVGVLGATTDDSQAFSIEGLRELALLTKCQVAVPSRPESSLEAVGIDHRPGLEHLATLPALQVLQIWNFNARSLAGLANFSTITKLKIEGKGQSVSLEGLESSESLIDVELLEMHIESLQPLRELSKLTRLWLIGASSFVSDHSLNLEELSSLSDLEELRITYQGQVASVEPLLNLPRLQDLRLRGTGVGDGNLEPLAVLANRAVVVGPTD